MIEEWRDIPGFEGRYKASSLGRIKSNSRIRKLCLNTSGYYTTGFKTKNKQKTYLVHHLVLLAFVGPRPEGLETRHLDGNCRNNSLSNLTYGTHKENMADRKIHGGFYVHGSSHYRHMLSEADVIKIRGLLNSGLTQKTIGTYYGVTRSCIQNIKRGHSWGWLR